MIFRKALSEVVENMRVVADSAQEYERGSSAAKVENVKLHVRGDPDSDCAVRRGIGPSVVGHIARGYGCNVSESGWRDAW
jgi:hypothetical protein